MTKQRRKPLALAATAVVLWFLSAAAGHAATPVTYGSTMRWVANMNDPGLTLLWIEPGFDDSAWNAGTYGVGYEIGVGAENLLQTAAPTNCSSVYTRATFEVTDPSQVVSVRLGVDYDDGYVAWLNGVEIARSAGMASQPAWNASAPLHESSNGAFPVYEVIDVTSLGGAALVPGTNVLAIGAWNSTLPSSDLVLVPQVTIGLPPSPDRGPYLQLGTPTGVTVRWRTDTPTASRVLFGPQPGLLTQSYVNSTPKTEHVVSLNGLLTPNTRYYYAVGTATEILAGNDASHYFYTAPPVGQSKPTRIWVLGDSGTGDSNARAVRDAYYAWGAGRETDLWLMLGDNAYPNGTDADYQTTLFEMYPGMLRRTVLWPTLGNHDGYSAESATQSGPYYDIFTLPRSAEAGGVSSGTEAYYSFDYANIHFVVLDSHETDRSDIAPMALWLRQDLAATMQDWIIAYWHHPPFSKGSHDSDTELQLIEMRENIVPILDDHGVDLALTGHSHSYERSFPIDGHYGDSTTFSESMKTDPGDGREDGSGPYVKPTTGSLPHSGTVHTVAGSSGQITGGSLDHPAMFLSLNELGSLVIDVNDTRMDLRFLDASDAVRDYFTIFKGPVVVAPTAAFDATPRTGPATLRVDFTDLSQNPATWAWDFDDNGTIDSTARNPSRNYSEPGIYSVRLTVSNISGTDQAVMTDAICAHAGPPREVRGLRSLGDRTTLEWDPEPTAVGYDLLRGDLGQLVQSAGDFTASQTGCLQDDTTGVSFSDGEVPPQDEGFYYLVRATNCAAQTGSFDTLGAGQAETRDDELQGATALCACDPADDLDADGFCNGFDACTDFDQDGWGDPDFAANTCPLDNCPSDPNPGQLDADTDSIGDACDACPIDPANDADADGVCGNVDNCPANANPTQSDLDADSLGDACDDCTDPDGDGLGNPELPHPSCAPDNCSSVFNPGQADADADGMGDACDTCPLDPADDVDRDGVCGDIDNCPNAANPTQDDADGDALGDACDTCPLDALNDPDLDGVCGDVDNCPFAANPNQADCDGDGLGDLCDLCHDNDNDGFGDPGHPGDECPPDNCPYRPNPTQTDADLDGHGDACDMCPVDPLDDVDLDFLCADADNCPTTNNPNQADTDSDGRGNACDTCPLDPSDDVDRDGVCGDIDNCPTVSNLTQIDADLDSIGDACDACPLDPLNDADLDSICDDVDNCPALANAGQENFDGDAAGDACDPDDDNDGFEDTSDCAPLHRGVASAPDAIGSSVRMTSQNGGTLLWNRSFQGHTANLYARNVLPGTSGPPTFACLAAELIATSAEDRRVLEDGELVEYLVTSRNSCGESDAGTGTGNVPRDLGPPCAPGGADSDLDGLLDVEDNCSSVANAGQADGDLDFVGDACDNCPADFNPDQADGDADGTGDACDGG